MHASKQHIAFFDIDKTILKINSGEALIRQAYRKGLMGTVDFINAIYMALQYKLSIKDTHKIILKMGSWLSGISVEMFNKLSNDIFQEDILPNIRPNIIREIHRLKREEIEVVILSSSIQSICIPIGEYLGMDDVICTEMEVIDGKYTGRPVDKFCFRGEKLTRLEKFCKRKNCNVNDVAYYADSIDDLSVLSEVGHPVCISPDKKLLKVASKKGWIVYQW